MKKTQLTTIGLALAVVLFFALNIAANATMRAWRADLTEDKVFTLEDGSKAIARGIEEPINLYFYLSREPAREVAPDLLDYANRVLDTLREYERASNGKIKLKVIDPEPFSEEEDLAVEQGIQGAQLPNGGVIYFGLVGTSATGEHEAIPFFVMEEEKQRTLEYDISKLIWTLAHPEKKKVGILTALALEGGGGNPMFGQQSEPAWPFLEQIGDFFDVNVLGPTADSLDDIDVLMVIHPRGFTDETLYQIDQWALAGKPLLVFVDPQCDVDPGASEDPSNPMSRFMAKKDSDLEKLFKPWGFELAKNKVVCDDQLAIRQIARGRSGRGQEEIPYIYLLRLGEESTSATDPVTRLLGNLVTVTAGSLKKLPEGTTTFTPLLETSERAAEVDSSQFQFVDPQALLASFAPDYKGRLALGARVTGNVKTAFPDGKPGATTPETPETPEGEAKPEDAAKPAGLLESTAPLNLIVFSDADMLHDRLWFRQLGQYPDGKPFGLYSSENVDLLKNALDSVSGGQELMSIRMRGKTLRPFDRVQEIQRDADQRFLARNQELERKLQDAERRLNELQKAKGEGSDDLISAEQRKEEEKVREELVQTRRDLRDVKHQLHKDIERLGSTLKWLNIALMPAVVCAAAVALGAMRVKQRTRK